ncbi:MAG TPA: quinone oxidoreductase [Kofleriaceae bacterium]|nr:quinone oxidoreductase [Kofleriaceae bacterium]
MRAIQIQRTGGPEVLQVVDVPIGEPGPGQVRVRHRACGINFIDTYHRSGLYAVKLPLVLGSEAAGVIDAVGPGVTGLAVGDRVGYAAPGPGSYAEARVLDANPVFKLPDAIDFEHAAAMMLKGLTVQYLLRRTQPFGGLHAGDAIVWHAAAGGVGLIACQWAAALGLVVIGTAGSDEKCELARRHGATHTINYRREDVALRVRELTGGRGVKVVYDAVGKDTWERSLDCLAPFGLMVSFGNASGAVPPISVLSLSAKGSLYLTRPTLNTHLADRSVGEQMARELFEMVTSGKVKIEIGQRYKLEDAAQAHRDLEGRKTTGSSILVV